MRNGHGTDLSDLWQPGAVGPAVLRSVRIESRGGRPAKGGAGTSRSRAGTQADLQLHWASVLFVDLVEYTSLTQGWDAADVRELLSGYFDAARTVVDRYGGVIEKFIGDAVVAVWGSDAAHEDDAERCVRAGLEVIEAVAEYGARRGTPSLAARAGSGHRTGGVVGRVRRGTRRR